MQEQTWWNQHVHSKMDDFHQWVGDSHAESKEYMATYLQKKTYHSLIDAGCGNATFYDTLQHNGINIQYIGVDSCQYFIEHNTTQGITMIESDIRHTPLLDSYVDIVFSRHTFEHQPHFKEIMKELLRIAKKEMTHIFFIKPSEKETIHYTAHDNLYHNCYSKQDIEAFLQEHSKVDHWTWVDINEKECALHVYLVQSESM